jgi:hypothetical protein
LDYCWNLDSKTYLGKVSEFIVERLEEKPGQVCFYINKSGIKGGRVGSICHLQAMKIVGSCHVSGVLICISKVF